MTSSRLRLIRAWLDRPMPAMIALLTASAAACGSGDRDVAIEFRALVGREPAVCGATYSGIGTSQSTMSLRELKMYVSEIALVDHHGAEVPLALEQDGVWQREDVALLDFEDGNGDCNTSNPQTHTTVQGHAPDGDYTGVRFTIGVPEAMNHLDAATAPAPFNEPGMWWSWKGGYKYIRLDVKTRGNPSYYLHLGATSCEGEAGAYTCAAGNAPRITVTGFAMDRSVVELDIAKLWADVDLDRQIDFRTDFVQGCMAFAGDPECPAVFARLGMTPSGERNDSQSVFTVGAR
jgi:uncharacterized repeat protein (TIGR04052 family)